MKIGVQIINFFLLLVVLFLQQFFIAWHQQRFCPIGRLPVVCDRVSFGNNINES